MGIYIGVLARSALIKSLNHEVVDNSDAVAREECDHIVATKAITSQIDAIHGVFPTIEFRGKYFAKFLHY